MILETPPLQLTRVYVPGQPATGIRNLESGIRNPEGKERGGEKGLGNVQVN